ncbi:ABC transporter ATP-binding protein [Actibacterium sp. 188UL27-1]|uniref:ABC transporter ATP-binding protein n=1 Tax=Actibacterium sp. 188UL27-1 TaxID=2786961 RepID=UPI00195E2A5B|nr:ABC transporter ATP-binding protein [Actibacterium sp. 188UL27-1]MBM7068276.1 ABC transporter ATP-binding protein [Actibacterium sp. 188UL27-1]
MAQGHVVKPDRLFAWLWTRFLGRHWFMIALATLLMAIEGSMMGLLSYMMKPMFDDVFIGGSRDALYWVGGGILGIFVLRAVTSVTQRVILSRVGALTVYDIQTKLLRHVMDLDSAFHQTYPPGAMIDRISGDSGAIRSIATTIISGAGRDIVALISLLTVVLWIDWQWTLVALIGTPLLVLPTLAVQSFVRRTTLISRQLAGKMTTRLDEIFHGIAPVKLNALERYQTKRYRDLADDRVKADVNVAMGRALIPALIDVMTGIGFFAVLLYGGAEIIDGTKTVGEFMSFFTAMALAFEPLRRLGNIAGYWQAAKVSIGRLKEFFDEEPNPQSPANPQPLPAGTRIALNDVHLSYGATPVLRGLSFVAEAGQTTALVGASGAGKSTVFNVLTRLVQPQSGQVTLDGTPIEALDLTDLRAQFSMVTQDALLFDETLLENITLGDDRLQGSLLESAMTAAHVTEFVNALPDGVNAKAGPRGSALSGGQRQRVAIARALLRDTPILLLDEATSALDVRSEAVVQDALEGLSRGRTTLVIAHRLSTVRKAHKIVVLDNGRVVEEGTHDALLAHNGTYAALHALQFEKGDR